jgi:hypothetical protein
VGGRTRKPPDRRQRRNKPPIDLEAFCGEPDCGRPTEWGRTWIDGVLRGPWCLSHGKQAAAEINERRRNQEA